MLGLILIIVGLTIILPIWIMNSNENYDNERREEEEELERLKLLYEKFKK